MKWVSLMRTIGVCAIALLLVSIVTNPLSFSQSVNIQTHSIENVPHIQTVEFVINGKTAKLILDTGAAAVTLTESFAESAGLNSTGSIQAITGVGSIQTLQVFENAEMHFKDFPDSTWTASLVIAPGSALEDLGVDGLLPPHLLTKNHCIYMDIRNAILEITSRNDCEKLLDSQKITSELIYNRRSIGNSHLLASGMINGVIFQGVIDTATTTSSFRIDLLHSEGVSKEECLEVIFVDGQTRCEAFGETVLIKIGDQTLFVRKPLVREVYPIPGIDAIIGTDILSEFPLFFEDLKGGYILENE